MTAQVFTIPIEGVPEGWEPVAVRTPNHGEHYIDEMGNWRQWLDGIFPFGPRLILRKKYTPPAWLKEAGFRCVVRRFGKWCALTGKPEFSQVESCWQGDGLGWHNLTNLNFTPPELPPGTADKDTLIEL